MFIFNFPYSSRPVAFSIIFNVTAFNVTFNVAAQDQFGLI